MGSIVFEENKILFVDNKIAFDCDCDCDDGIITEGCLECYQGTAYDEYLITIPEEGWGDEFVAAWMSGEFVVPIGSDGLGCFWWALIIGNGLPPPFTQTNLLTLQFLPGSVLHVAVFRGGHSGGPHIDWIVDVANNVDDTSTPAEDRPADCLLPDSPISVPWNSSVSDYGEWDPDVDITVEPA